MGSTAPTAIRDLLRTGADAIDAEELSLGAMAS